MNEFALIFRNDFHPEAKFSPAEMQNIMQQWQAWMGGMAAKGQLANPGTRLGGDGATVRPSNIVTNGPYAEIKEMVTGVIVVKASGIDEAAEIAKGCPILNAGGNVEVRNIVPIGAN
ncbi:MAG TPA: YciI family protein [Mucilaginibacter sp.]|nr:YciI family protein [Mucilaginibacter sp.]